MMKKFALKGVLFFTIIFLICGFILFLSTKEPTRSIFARWTVSEDFMRENEMIPYFEMAREQDETTQLVIGDSICRQMFSGLSDYNPQASFLATNAALMITGQYLMAEEYLKSHPDTTDVFLVMHPLTLVRTIDTEWSYRYAVMTYIETDTLQYLDKNTIEVMTDVFGNFFMNKNVVQMIEDSPIVRKLCLSYINISKKNYEQSFPFEISDQYVKKLYDLCEKNGVELHLYSSPVADYYRDEVAELSKSYEGTWMSSQYPDYIKNIFYYPSEWAEDLSHFSGIYAERDKLNETIKQAYGQTVLLEEIKLN